MEALEPLGDLPGVETAMLLTPDGVPIAVVGGSSLEPHTDGLDDSASGREEALAALAGGWANELGHATAPLSWSPPTRVVLRCARGSMVMRQLKGAVLLLVLDRNADPEDMRLPMDGAAARIERGLKKQVDVEPPGPIPSKKEHRRTSELAETLQTPPVNSPPGEELSGD